LYFDVTESPFPPLPVVVPIVVDLLDRDRCFGWDVVREVIRALLTSVSSASSSRRASRLLVFGQRLGVAGSVPKMLRCGFVEGVDDPCRRFAGGAGCS